MTPTGTRARTQMRNAEIAVQARQKGLEAPGGVAAAQTAADQGLSALVTVYWGLQDAGDLQALKGDYLRVLDTLKQVADDVFVGGSAEDPTLTPAQRSATTERMRVWYVGFVETWIRASPVFDRQAARAIQFPNRARVPLSITIAPTLDMPANPFRVLIDKLLARAGKAIEADIDKARRAQRASSAVLRWTASDELVHLLGIPFLLLQLDLMDRATLVPPSSQFPDWYRAVELRVDWLRTRILDVILRFERDAIAAGNASEIEVFRAATLRYFAQLAVTYTMRSQELATLWTIVAPSKSAAITSLQRRIVAPDGTSEIITALHGQTDPDNQANAGAITVDQAIDDFANLNGTDIRVFGQRRSGVLRFRLMNLDGTRGIDVAAVQLLLPGSDDRFVVVDGRLGGVPANPSLDATALDEFRVPYVSRVGLNMDLFAQPLWRSHTKAVVAAEQEERRSDSLSSAIVGQLLLEADLLRFPNVRGLATRARPNRVDVRDRKVRVAAWQAVFEALAKDPRMDAEAALLDLEQRYLSNYTRHTFWNIRDGGTNYLDSTWPSDVASQTVHDCGVYALEVAWDLFLTVHGVSGRPTIEFTLLATPDHLTMLVVIGDRFAVVNNRDLTKLADLPVGADRNGRIQAATFQAVGTGYRAVHNYKWNVVPFIESLTPLNTTAGTDPFKEGIWKAFLGVVHWNLEPSKPNLSYFTEMQEFNRASAVVEAAWNALPHGFLDQNPSDPKVTAVTDFAKKLFDGAEDLVNVTRFKGKPVGTCGISLNQTPMLPMYQLAMDLKGAADRGAPLTGPQQDLIKRRPSHEKLLFDLFCTPGSAPASSAPRAGGRS